MNGGWGSLELGQPGPRGLSTDHPGWLAPLPALLCGMEPGQRQWGLERASWVSGQRGSRSGAPPLEEAPFLGLKPSGTHTSPLLQDRMVLCSPNKLRPSSPALGRLGLSPQRIPIKHGPLREGHRAGFQLYLCHNLFQNRNENCVRKYDQGDFFHLTYVERKHQSNERPGWL